MNKKPEKWNNSNDSYSLKNSKYLGIYFGAKIDHLADYLIYSPAYDFFQDNVINLKQEIPKEIIDQIKPYETKVMNHFDSGTYDYSAASNSEVPEFWTEFRAEYKGFSFGYGDIKGKYRPETKTVSPFALCNYGQNEDAILEIKNIEIICKDKPKFK